MTITDIIQNHKSLEELLFEVDGILTDEQQEFIIDQWMAENKNELVQKIDGYVFKINNLDTTSELFKAKSIILSNKAKTMESLSKRLIDRLKYSMQELNMSKIETDNFTLKIQNNPVKLEIINEKEIPLDYFNDTIVTELDKSKLKEDLKSGKEIKGAQLVQNTRLSIK